MGSEKCMSREPYCPVIIPTLDPDRRLCEIVDQLHERGVSELIIVDDGSNVACHAVFLELEKKDFCVVLHHEVNRGKGAALRTAFMHYLAHHPEGIGCVTADDDGQHCIEDILNVAAVFQREPDSLILGKRDFSGEEVPWKSRVGNVLTRGIFRLLARIRISDTQTGLRAIPTAVMEDSLNIKGNRFEFETEMLLRASDALIPFREVTIRTVYLNNNEATHFHPIRDAARIYSVILKHLFQQFFRFVLVSMSSALIDFLAFFSLTQLLKDPGEAKRPVSLLIASVSARVLSAIWNYLLNRFWVFRGPGERRGVFPSSIGYFLLCIGILSASYGLTLLCSYAVPYRVLPYCKVLIDAALFIVSYLVQKCVIFRRKNE